eukprot:Hpha_TRINITY_DN16140_c0_g4::TRINITY_DN16140_c0_g4_i1::g.8596::m.8596
MADELPGLDLPSVPALSPAIEDLMTPGEHPRRAKVPPEPTAGPEVRRFSVSIRVIVALAGILIVAVGLVGGLVLYFEAVNALEKSAEESSASHAANIASQVRQLFLGTEEEVEILRHFNENHTFPKLTRGNLSAFVEGIHSFEWGSIEPSPYLYGSATALVHSNGSQYLRAATWWDPLASGERDWTAGMYYQGLIVDGVPAYSEAGPKIHAFRMNGQDGTFGELMYSYSVSIPEKASQRAAEGHRSWGGPSYWVSVDETSYLYMTYQVYAPPNVNFPEHVQVFDGFFISETWQDMMRKARALDKTIHMAVMDLGWNPRGRIVFAHTLYHGTTLKKGCAGNSGNCIGCNPGQHPCMRMVEDLGDTVTAAAEVLSWEPYGTFLRHELPSSTVVFDMVELGLVDTPNHVEEIEGGDYFLRRVRVWKYGEVESCPNGDTVCGEKFTSIDLLWMKPTSSLESSVNRALVSMIIVILMQFLVVALMVLVQLFFVATPMRTLVDAATLVQALDIAGARQVTRTVRRGVSEVDSLAEAFDLTLRDLEEYRRFLPLHLVKRASTQRRAEVLPPEGNVAVFFSDIQSSTLFWSEMPIQMDIALDTHNSVMRAKASEFGGYEVKTIGDAFMYAFPSVIQAVECAITVQEALLFSQWPLEFEEYELTKTQLASDGTKVWGGLRVRIGIAAGEVTSYQDPVTYRYDYRGTTVNRASRMESNGFGGALTVGEEVYKELQQRKQDIGFCQYVGEKDLKGLGKTAMYLVLPSALRTRGESLLSSQKNDASNPLPGRRLFSNPSMPSMSMDKVNMKSRPSVSSDRTVDRLRSIGVISDSKNSDSSDSRTSGASGRFGHDLFVPSSVAMVANLDGGLTSSLTKNDTETCKWVKDFIQRATVVAITSSVRTQGAVQGCIGNVLSVVWNVHSPCPGYELSPLRYSLLLEEAESRGVVGVASGAMLQGVFGTSRQRFHSAIGLPTEIALQLTRQCHEFGTTTLAVYIKGTPDVIKGNSVPVDAIMRDDKVLIVERPDLGTVIQNEGQNMHFVEFRKHFDDVVDRCSIKVSSSPTQPLPHDSQPNTTEILESLRKATHGDRNLLKSVEKMEALVNERERGVEGSRFGSAADPAGATVLEPIVHEL